MYESSITESIQAIKQGDIERYAAIVRRRRYQQEIFVYCCHLLMHRQKAEDDVEKDVRRS